MSKKFIISGVIGLLVMVLSLGVGLYLAKNRQNIFPKANFDKRFMASGPLMYFDPTQTSVVPTAGQTFSVKLMLNLNNENPLIGAPCQIIESKTECIGQPLSLKATSAEIHLKYPYDSVSFVGVVNSSDFAENLGQVADSGSIPAGTIEPGLLSFSVGTGTTPKGGILTVATLNFKTKDNRGTKPMMVPEIQIVRPDTKVAGIDANGIPQSGDILVKTTNASVAFVSSIPGDINGNGKVDIFDYNTLVSKFGNPYTIFDYNTLVANFGKGGSAQVPCKIDKECLTGEVCFQPPMPLCPVNNDGIGCTQVMPQAFCKSKRSSIPVGCRYQDGVMICEAGVDGNNVIPEGKISPSGFGGSGQ